MAGRKRTWTDEQLIQAVKDSFSLNQVMKKLGLIPKGGNHSSIRAHVKRLGLSTKHFSRAECIKARAPYTVPKRRKPLKELLIVGYSGIPSSELRPKLLETGLIEDRCYVCNRLPEWEGKPLKLQLDHINGNTLDNRLENLRSICPNCHSQTETYTGRNVGKQKISGPSPSDRVLSDLEKERLRTALGEAPTTYEFKIEGNKETTVLAGTFCCDCLVAICKDATRCEKCYAKSIEKTDWPEIESLLEEVNKYGMVAVGKRLGVTGNAIKKRLKSRGVWDKYLGYPTQPGIDLTKNKYAP